MGNALKKEKKQQEKAEAQKRAAETSAAPPKPPSAAEALRADPAPQVTPKEPDASPAEVENKPVETSFKILLVGDTAAGKTCLLNQYSQKSFNPKTPKTDMLDFDITEETIDGVKRTLQVSDVSSS